MGPELLSALKLFTLEPAKDLDGVVVFDAPEVVLRPPIRSSDDPLYRVGCAAVNRPGCPDATVAGPAPACLGRIRRPDMASTTFGQRLEFRPPGYHGKTGSAKLLLHLGSNGKVCGVALAGSSGFPVFDRAAADAAAQWAIQPAMKGSEHVESLLPIRLAIQ